MRVFAGPNGSGKTTILKSLRSKYRFGVYINADDIEAFWKQKGFLDFNNYDIDFSTDEIHKFLSKEGFSNSKLENPKLYKQFFVEENKLKVKAGVILNSYIAADIAEMIRRKLLATGKTFTYETVMSHPAKVDFLKQAQKAGFKVYLYFIATEDPEININRVKLRVMQKGHNVDEEKIKLRYYRSLLNLRSAIKNSDRAFLFDNSGNASVLVSEIENGEDVFVVDPENTPIWFVNYLVNDAI